MTQSPRAAESRRGWRECILRRNAFEGVAAPMRSSTRRSSRQVCDGRADIPGSRRSPRSRPLDSRVARRRAARAQDQAELGAPRDQFPHDWRIYLVGGRTPGGAVLQVAGISRFPVAPFVPYRRVCGSDNERAARLLTARSHFARIALGSAVLKKYPRSVRRWLLFIALLHWLIFIILLLQGISKHARTRKAPLPSGPQVQGPASLSPGR
jgi:hypothetical protein